MKKIPIFCLFAIPLFAYPQQESTIKNVKSNGGKIEVIQNEIDSAQKSYIDSVQGDSLKINITQGNTNVVVQSNTNAFQQWILNTNNIFVLIGSICVAVGGIWAGISKINKMKKKK